MPKCNHSFKQSASLPTTQLKASASATCYACAPCWSIPSTTRSLQPTLQHVLPLTLLQSLLPTGPLNALQKVLCIELEGALPSYFQATLLPAGLRNLFSSPAPDTDKSAKIIVHAKPITGRPRPLFLSLLRPRLRFLLSSHLAPSNSNAAPPYLDWRAHNIELSRPAVSPMAKPSNRVYDSYAPLQAGR
jgi:hypothetical protein